MIHIDREKCVSCLRCVRGCPMAIFRAGENGAPTVAKEDRCIRCYHCTAACPMRAISFEDLPTERTYLPAPEDPVEKLVQSRRSVRHFSEKLPDRALVERALRLSAWAPSGKNIHENGWAVLWGKTVVEKARDMAIAWAEETGIYPELPKNARRGIDLLTCGASCVIIGHSHPKTLNPMLDTAVASATAELLLCESGIATCWGGYLRHAINDSPALKAFVGIAPEREAYSLFMAGYADGETYPNIPERPPLKTIWVEAPESI